MKYSLTKEDYIVLQTELIQQKKVHYLFMRLFCGVMGAVLSYFLLGILIKGTLLLMISAIVAVGFFFLFVPVFKDAVKRNVEAFVLRSPEALTEREVILADDHIVLSKNGETSTIPYSDIESVKEANTFLSIYTSDEKGVAPAMMIPLRVFETPEAVEAFVSAVLEKW